jgi:large subunit ribosomal protein L4
MTEKVKKETIKVKLDPKVWEVPFNEDLVTQVLYILSRNERKGTSSVKSRAQVTGGGRKPWKQKGTGRARQGSIRSPLWVGGGVSFGPNVRNWKRKINKKMNRKAICMMLSQRNKEEVIKFKEFGTQKELKNIRDNLKKELKRGTLIVSENEKIDMALRNIKGVEIVNPMKLNLKNIVRAKNILIEMKAINILEKRLTNGK